MKTKNKIQTNLLAWPEYLFVNCPEAINWTIKKIDKIKNISSICFFFLSLVLVWQLLSWLRICNLARSSTCCTVADLLLQVASCLLLFWLPPQTARWQFSQFVKGLWRMVKKKKNCSQNRLFSSPDISQMSNCSNCGCISHLHSAPFLLDSFGCCFSTVWA